MGAGTEQLLWYAAYGSNLLPERFATYLTGSSADSVYGVHAAAPDPTPPRDSRRSTMRYPMYFAGHSMRWSSPVAFVELTGAQEEYPCRLYLVSVAQLLHVMCAENGVESIEDGSSLFDGIDVGGWARLPVASRGDQSRAKYNALLRLADVDGRPAFTLTTCRTLDRGVPSEAYLATVRRGLESLGMSDVEAKCVVEAALARSAMLEER